MLRVLARSSALTWSQRAGIEWRGRRRGADVDEREVIASRRGRAVEGATDWQTAVRKRRSRIVSEPCGDGRDADRA